MSQLQSLLLKAPQTNSSLEEKKAMTAKLIAADKARAAALLSSTLASLRAASPSINSVKKNVIV